MTFKIVLYEMKDSFNIIKIWLNAPILLKSNISQKVKKSYLIIFYSLSSFLLIWISAEYP